MPARSRLRLLLVTPFLPDPGSSHGGGSYLGSLFRGLAEHADLALATLLHPGERARLDAGPWRAHFAADYRGQPRPGSPGHALSMAFCCASRRLPLVVAKHWQPELPPLLRRARQQFEPHCALVEQAVMAQYLPHLRGLPTVLTDHEDGVPERTVTGRGRLCDRVDAWLWRRYVHRCYPQADLLQALTAADAARLTHELGTEVAQRAPVVDVPSARVRCERAPPHALFLGDYRHHPNPEAVQRLVRDVLPRLRQQQPAAELLLAGPHAERLGDAANAPGVRVLGFVPDLQQLLSMARCLLAPLYSGGGFRVKVLTALGHGLPVVTNSRGAQGIDGPPAALRCVETPEQLAAATLHWLGSPTAAAEASAAAHAWALQHVAPNAVAEAQLARVERLLAR